jgi:hypothetical protein
MVVAQRVLRHHATDKRCRNGVSHLSPKEGAAGTDSASLYIRTSTSSTSASASATTRSLACRKQHILTY